MNRFRALYGAGPLNLLVVLFSFAITGFAVVGWFQRPRDVVTVIEWFVAAILLHDLVALPLYSLLDRIAFGRLRRDRGPGRTVIGAVNSTPYLRVPAILSGLLLVVFFPVIFGFGAQTELSASGIAESGYLARWLIASGVMFALSGVAWGVAVGRGRRRPAAGRLAAGARPMSPRGSADEPPAGGAPSAPPGEPGVVAPPAGGAPSAPPGEPGVVAPPAGGAPSPPGEPGVVAPRADASPPTPPDERTAHSEPADPATTADRAGINDDATRPPGPDQEPPAPGTGPAPGDTGPGASRA
ncbi:MAG TPA: hypothetical protein VG186_09875 [Solirubrobacteraceae bacterium]|jgi:hypothetical protein|nr:hypothetical protein [Solirubrobacteraceae bacterium]